MKKINLKQAKYILPLVIVIPVVGLIYVLTNLFSGSSADVVVAEVHEGINTELPEPALAKPQTKLESMENSRENSFDEYDEMEGSPYGADEEIIDAEAEARARADFEASQAALAELEASLAAAQDNVYRQPQRDNYQDNYEQQMFEMELARAKRQRMVDSIANPEKYAPKPVVEVKEEEKPALVVKTRNENHDQFNTLVGEDDEDNSPLIRALIDQITKATQNSRLRFKLMDDVTIKDTKIPKGTYLYGQVSGFSEQRVKVNITSIMVGDKFLKVDLAVFDNDGIEGFYVPESEFREFMKDAASGTVSQGITINSGGYGNGISGEMLAMQALQNIYSSATSAVNSHIRKNRAKIKYSTVVYLINSKDAN